MVAKDYHISLEPINFPMFAGYYQYTEGNFRKYQQGEICQHDTNKLLENIQRLQRNLPGAKARTFFNIKYFCFCDELH